jgi:hypothetical protein
MDAALRGVLDVHESAREMAPEENAGWSQQDAEIRFGRVHESSRTRSSACQIKATEDG